MRGKGVGRALVVAAIQEATTAGYHRMRLDSLKRLKAAAKMYRELGFQEIPAYNENQHSDVYYMERELR